MLRTLLAAGGLFLAVSGTGAQKDAPAQDKDWKDLRIAAKTAWYYGALDRGTPPKQVVLRTPAELLSQIGFRTVTPEALKASNEIARLLGVAEIDWKKHMVLVVTGGVKPTGGYRVDLLSVKAKEKKAVAKWSLSLPEGAGAPGITNPGIVALVDRFEGKIEFVQEGK